MQEKNMLHRPKSNRGNEDWRQQIIEMASERHQIASHASAQWFVAE